MANFSTWCCPPSQASDWAIFYSAEYQLYLGGIVFRVCNTSYCSKQQKKRGEGHDRSKTGLMQEETHCNSEWWKLPVITWSNEKLKPDLLLPHYIHTLTLHSDLQWLLKKGNKSLRSSEQPWGSFDKYFDFYYCGKVLLCFSLLLWFTAKVMPKYFLRHLWPQSKTGTIEMEW